VAYVDRRPRAVLCLCLIAGLGLGVAGCRSSQGPKLGERVIPVGQPVPKGGGRYHIGEPYEIASVEYEPKEDPAYSRVGTASWYGELFHGRRTANGEIFDMDRLSAAHPTLPLPIHVRVTNLNNGRSLIVRVNDRGPFTTNRIIDLSRRSAEMLGFRHKGTATVRVKYLRRAPLNGDDSYEQRHLANQSWMRVASRGRREQVVAKNPIEVGSIPASPKVGAEKQKPRAVVARASPHRQAVAGRGPSRQQAAKPSSDDKSLSIQAGSFKIKGNADRARSTLASIGSVEVAEVEVRGSTFFRVRVGAFADTAEAKAALVRVTRAGYIGAKIINN
jgi:rare lipoprotein A